ncbi:SAM-dependent DNA methyltransferase [Flavobacterium rhamnosiphilum]|uniref:SAM-dependent DNA methyltransferase n=1 Tax=Flavobacterium rhamnosiphilum TaxID=2541724 RepID=A0A4R5FAQ7_9FLAO|nr:N-6 DNA methylase [Flavobacterium rhamnosiphilum]TDE45581.1 SAM-dependent DNA methyltransferase [Flavobacterium rhamnosiphilum]
MEKVNEILIRIGFLQSFIKDRLREYNETPINNIWVLENKFKDPFLALVMLNDRNELELTEIIKATLPLIGLIVFFDGTEIKRIQVKNFSDKSFDYTNEVESPKKIETTKSLIFGDIDEGFRPLKQIDKSVEGLFFEAHSIIRDIDGLHADQALDEVCKFLYAKLYDEESLVKNTYYFFQRCLYSSSEELASVVRGVYARSTEYDDRVYSMRIPKYKKSRGVFNTEMTLSAPALVKLVGLFEAIDLSSSKVDVKGRAFQKMMLPAMRAGLGQYFTPLPIIKFIVDVLNPNVDDLIIDPFSGSGHFLTQSLFHVTNNNSKIPEKKIHEFKFHKLHGIEKSERMVRISMTDMRLHGDGHSNIRCTDALLSFDNYEDLKESSFDIVMSNPPFGSILSKEALSRLDSFELMKGRNSVPLEILGLERCIQLLRTGGRLGIVLPESIITNKNTKFVRDWLLQKITIVGIVGLPLETFSPYGANIKTVILFGVKENKSNKGISNKEILIGNISSVGYDFKGQDTGDSDINDLIKPLKILINKI